MKDKIAFLLYGTDEWILSENLEYLNSLYVPDDIDVEIYKLNSADGLLPTFENGRLLSDARYKVYLNQNTYIIDKKFIPRVIGVFQNHPQIGMIGVRGFRMDQEKNQAEFEGYNLSHVYDIFSFVREFREGTATGIIPVLALDRHLMVTSADTPWIGEESNFHIAKSVELRHAGIETVVMVADQPMVLFDNGVLTEK